MTDDLGMKVSRLLLQEKPLLLKADVDASAEVCVVLSTLIGLQLANVLAQRGGTYYRECLKLVMLKVDEDARAGAVRAARIAATESAPATH